MPLLPADRMRYGSSQVEPMASARVVIDSREVGLIQLFQAHADGFEVAALKCGDVMVEYGDGCRGWVCERKTGADAAASLKDGRWKDHIRHIALLCGTLDRIQAENENTKCFIQKIQ